MQNKIDSMSQLSTDTIHVLDHGYVKLIDVMPRLLDQHVTFENNIEQTITDTCDHAIVDAARVSYQQGTQRKSTDAGLIDYLIRHRHTSPLEMVEFKFECRMPVFIARQWIRHRTANVNEESARYSVLKDMFYIPDGLRQQSQNNKQATEDILFDPMMYPDDPYFCKETAIDQIKNTSEDAYNLYSRLLDKDICREQARMVLPVNIYTSWVWKIDLHNLLHFLKLRLDSHAQYEIRVYAKAIAEFVKQLCPYTWQSYENHILCSQSFSQDELALIENHLSIDTIQDLLRQAKQNKFSDTRIKEFERKLLAITGPL